MGVCAEWLRLSGHDTIYFFFLARLRLHRQS
jgi:hypothetical protein